MIDFLTSQYDFDHKLVLISSFFKINLLQDGLCPSAGREYYQTVSNDSKWILENSMDAWIFFKDGNSIACFGVL